ncbi:MAG: FHA domain-containing protein [Candidatus Eremiobacteraeota bacterium]|nr:FHA domain-containing protein [Candidatus Eremiobacteraeota bacterium]
MSFTASLQLRVTGGPGLGSLYPLRYPHMRLGRTNQPQDGFEGWIFLDDHTVSRLHAELNWDEAQSAYVLSHRSQTNPTVVNDQPVERHRLQVGDNLRLGTVNMTVEMVPAPNPRDTETMLDEGDSGYCLVDTRSDERHSLTRPRCVAEVGTTLAFGWLQKDQTFQVSQASEEEIDIFVTRTVDGATWSTELRSDDTITLRAGDRLRIGKTRVVFTRS